MQSLTSDNSGFSKLKSIMFLALSCNYTTMFGCIIVGILLQRNEWTPDLWQTILWVVCLMPFFMGDAVNNYVLGRIRLEQQNDWDDIQITTECKSRLTKFYFFFRGISLASSYAAAGGLLYLIGHKTSLPHWLDITIITLFCLNIIASLTTIITGIEPALKAKKPNAHRISHRAISICVIGICWYLFYRRIANIPLEKLSTLINGIIYFVLCGFMNPLPTKNSLIASILKDSIATMPQEASNMRTRIGRADPNDTIIETEAEKVAISETQVIEENRDE